MYINRADRAYLAFIIITQLIMVLTLISAKYRARQVERRLERCQEMSRLAQTTRLRASDIVLITTN